MKPEILITIIATAIVSIFIWEAFRMTYRKFFVEEPIKHYQPDRHEYPKKEDIELPPNFKWIDECNEVDFDKVKDILDKRARIQSDIDIHRLNVNFPKKHCECDCAGECKTSDQFKQLDDFFFDSGDFELSDIKHMIVEYSDINAKFGTIKEYMRRGSRRYFRGDNIKVVVTVKGGEYE
jgi:hypothetical protein